jgi:hypothetical protein
MTHRMAPGISLAIVLFAAATVAFRVAARRPQPPSVPGAERAPATVTADESRPRTLVTSGTQDGAAPEVARPPDPPGQPASVVEQMKYVFHELHADGRSTLCTVCDGRYGSPVPNLA